MRNIEAAQVTLTELLEMRVWQAWRRSKKLPEGGFLKPTIKPRCFTGYGQHEGTEDSVARRQELLRSRCPQGGVYSPLSNALSWVERASRKRARATFEVSTAWSTELPHSKPQTITVCRCTLRGGISHDSG